MPRNTATEAAINTALAYPFKLAAGWATDLFKWPAKDISEARVAISTTDTVASANPHHSASPSGISHNSREDSSETSESSESDDIYSSESSDNEDYFSQFEDDGREGRKATGHEQLGTTGESSQASHNLDQPPKQLEELPQSTQDEDLDKTLLSLSESQLDEKAQILDEEIQQLEKQIEQLREQLQQGPEDSQSGYDADHEEESDDESGSKHSKHSVEKAPSIIDPDTGRHPDYARMFYEGTHACTCGEWAYCHLYDPEEELNKSQDYGQLRGLSCCNWYRAKVAPKTKPGVPALTVTIPDGETYYLRDLNYYPGESNWADSSSDEVDY